MLNTGSFVHRLSAGSCCGRRDDARARAALTALLAGAVCVAASCTPYELAPLPLEVTIVPNVTRAAVGTEITFQLNAQGGILLGIVVDFGDGETESFQAHGARTARTSVRHAYTAAGAYEVAARVEDAQLGERTATVAVTIE